MTHMTPEPIEVPSYAMLDPFHFSSWLTNVMWDEVMPALVACPLCGATVLNMYTLMMRHSLWHAGNLFRAN